MQDNFKGLIKSFLTVEFDTKLGKYNWAWFKGTFLIWLVLTFVGVTIKYVPTNDFVPSPKVGEAYSFWDSVARTMLIITTPIRGFELKIGEKPIWAMAVIAWLTLPICAVGLLYLVRKGWITKDDI